MPKRKVTLFTLSPLVLIALSYAYLGQTASTSLEGATIESKIYLETADAQITHLGSKTSYISAKGNWSTIKRNARNEIEQVLIADADRGGVFLVSKDSAAKMGNFKRNTAAVKATDFRQSSQHAGEVTFLGYPAFVQHMKDDNGQLMSEIITIPKFRLAVKTIDYEKDGSKIITEAISITLGEPEEAKVKLSKSIPITMDIPEPRLNPQP